MSRRRSAAPAPATRLPPGRARCGRAGPARSDARRSRRRACRRGRAPGLGSRTGRAARRRRRARGRSGAASETKERLLAAWRISVRPVRQKRPISRQVPGQVRLERRSPPAQPSDPVGVAGADHQRRGPEQHLAVDRPASGGRRGTGGPGPGPDRCWRGPARAAPAAGAGSRRGRERSAARPAHPPATASRSDQAPAQLTTKPASVAPRSCSTVMLAPRGCSARTPAPVTTIPPGRLDVLRVGGRDPGEVDDPRLGRVERRHAAGVRLDLGDLVAVDPPQAGDLVGLGRAARARRGAAAHPRPRRRSACRPCAPRCPRSSQ